MSASTRTWSSASWASSRHDLHCTALHCTAVRVIGGDPERLELAATCAADLGLEVWSSPYPLELTIEEMLALLADCAERAERLRSTSWAWISTDRPRSPTNSPRASAPYLRELLEIFDAAGVDSAFVFAPYGFPHRPDGDARDDLGLASPGIVKVSDNRHGDTYPDLPWEPKAAFAALAGRYR